MMNWRVLHKSVFLTCPNECIQNNPNHDRQALSFYNQTMVDRRSPKRKMQQKGAQQLSNAELLALLIGSGHRGESAVHLMQRLLSSVDNNILELHAMAIEKMMERKGIGLAKAVKIKAP